MSKKDSVHLLSVVCVVSDSVASSSSREVVGRGLALEGSNVRSEIGEGG